MSETPIALIHALATMLPRLQAEEQLTAIRSAIAGGSVSMDGADVQRRLSELERLAMADPGRRRAPPASPAMLAAMGIAVVEAEAATEGASA